MSIPPSFSLVPGTFHNVLHPIPSIWDINLLDDDVIMKGIDEPLSTSLKDLSYTPYESTTAFSIETPAETTLEITTPHDALSKLDSYTYLQSFSPKPHFPSSTKLGLKFSESLATTSLKKQDSISGFKRKRDEEYKEKYLDIFDIPEIRLFVHALGDKYLNSIPKSQGFEPTTFLNTFIKIITELPEIDSFDKKNYLESIKLILIYQKGLDAQSLSKEVIQNIVINTILTNAKITTTEKKLTRGAILASISTRPLPLINSDFNNKIYNWLNVFFQSYGVDCIQSVREAEAIGNILIKSLHGKYLENLDLYCQIIKADIEKLSPGESLFLPTGFAGAFYGHFCVASITKQEDLSYTIKIYNTGSGLANHHRIIINGKEYAQFFIEFKNIPEEILMQTDSSGSLSVLMSFFEYTNTLSLIHYKKIKDTKFEDLFYESLFLYLEPYYNYTSTQTLFFSPQKTGTCVYRAIKALIPQFCTKELDYKSIFKQIKIEIFTQSFTALSEKHAEISKILPIEFDLLKACLKKLSDQTYKDIKTDESQFFKNFTIAQDIKTALIFLDKLKTIKSPPPNTQAPLIWDNVITSIDLSDINDLASFVTSPDSSFHSEESLEMHKFSDLFNTSIIELNLEQKIEKTLKVMTDATDSLLSTEFSNYNFFILLKDIDLNNDKILEEITDHSSFLENLFDIAKYTFDIDQPNLNLAILSKCYLLTHKLLTNIYPALFNDLPISFGKYETLGYLPELNLADPVIGEFWTNCIQYVDTFNQITTPMCPTEKKTSSFLFETILSNTIALDSTYEKPLDGAYPADFLLYKRILEQHSDLQLKILQNKPRQLNIDALDLLYRLPEPLGIESDLLQRLSYLKQFKIYLDIAFYHYSYGNSKISFARITESLSYKSCIDESSCLFTYSIANLKQVFLEKIDSVNECLIEIIRKKTKEKTALDEFIKNPQERLWAYQLVELAFSGKTKWVCLINMISLTEQLIWLEKYADIFQECLFHSSKDDIINTQLHSDVVSNEHFQAVLIKSIIDSCYDLSLKTKVSSIKTILLTVLAKVIPFINQAYIDSFKLNAICNDIALNMKAMDKKDLDQYLLILNCFSHLDLSLIGEYQKPLCRSVMNIFLKIAHNLIKSNITTLHPAHLKFFEFFKTNAAIFSTNLELAKIIYHAFCNYLYLVPYPLQKVNIDEKNYHIEFITTDNSSLYIDILLHSFVKNQKLEYVNALSDLGRPVYYSYLLNTGLSSTANHEGDIEFIYGIYKKSTDLFIPSDLFETYLPHDFKNKKWQLSWTDFERVCYDKDLDIRSLLAKFDSFTAFLFSQQDDFKYFIFLDSRHSPLGTIKFENEKCTIFDSLAKKELLIPKEDHFLLDLFPQKNISIYKNADSLEVVLKINDKSEDTIIIPDNLGLSIPKDIYLKNHPDYTLDTTHFSELKSLKFKNLKDPSLSEFLFFSPELIDDVFERPKPKFDVIIKADAKNNQVISDNFGITVYMAYVDFIEKKYDLLIDKINKLNSRNIILYKPTPFDNQIVASLSDHLIKNYTSNTLEAAILRYFILSLAYRFKITADSKKKLKIIFYDYTLDTKKHHKITLSKEIIKSLEYQLEVSYRSFDLDHSDIKQIYTRRSFDNFKDFSSTDALNIFNIYKKVKFRSESLTIGSILKKIQNNELSQIDGLKFFLGKKNPEALLAKALIQETTILSSLKLSDQTASITTINENLGLLSSYICKTLQYPSAEHLKSHSLYQKELKSLLSLSLTPTQTNIAFSSQTLIKDISKYNRLILIFIQSQISGIKKEEFILKTEPILTNLAMVIDKFSKELETNILKGCQFHIIKEDSGLDKIIEIPRYFVAHEKLSIEALIEPYLKSSAFSYLETLKGYDIEPFHSLSDQESSFYTSLDIQIGFYLYLKTFKNQLHATKKRLLEGQLNKEELIKTIDKKRHLIHYHKNQLVFEYKFGHSLSIKQQEIIDFLSSNTISQFKLAQVIMGGGKSSVIVPLLSSIFTKNESCLLITPEAQLGSILKYLDLTLNSIFYQSIETFNFKGNNLSLSYLEKVFEKLSQPIPQKILFISSPESIQFLQLEFLKLLEDGDPLSKDTITKAQLINDILEYFYSKTSVIIDEFSHIADVRKQTNIPLLSKHPKSLHIPLDYIRFSEDLFLSVFTMLKTYDITPQTALEKWEDYIECFVNILMSQKTILSLKKDPVLIKKFLIEVKNEKFLKDDNLCFIKYLLHFVLPHVLEKTKGRHYGRTFNPDTLGKVVPYQGVSCPSSTEFGHYYETICYHYLTCLNSCYSQEEIDFLINHLYTKAKNASSTYRSNILHTNEGILFQNIFGFPITEATNKAFIETAYHLVVKFYKEGNFSPLLQLESILVNQYVKLRNVYLSSNPHNLISQFSKVCGFTGTPWNKDIYNLAFKGAQKFDDEIEKSIDTAFIKKEKEAGSSLIFHQRIKDPEKILTSFLSFPDFSKICSFIDTGGIFSNFTNKNVAEKIAHFYLENKPILSKFDVIYFDQSTDSSNVDTPHLLSAHRSGLKIITTTKTLDSLQEADLVSAGVSKGAYFIYFDERRTVGTDITLGEDAIGLITLDKTLCHHAFLQGLMRLRQYDKKQNALVINFDEKIKEISSHSDLIIHLKKNEQQTLQSIVYRSFKQQLHDVVRSEAILEVMNCITSEAFSEAKTMYQKYNPIFITEETITPSSLIKEALLSQDPVEGLSIYASSLYKLLPKPSISEKLEKILKEADSYFKGITLESSVEFGTELTLEQQIEKEVDITHKKELNQQLQIEINSLLSLKQEPSDKEIPFPIEEVLSFYQLSKGLFTKDDFKICPLNVFNKETDVDYSYEEGFNFNVSCNALLAKDASYLDIRSLEKKKIFSFLAILHAKKIGGLAFSYTPEIIFIALTEKETAPCLDYLLKNPLSKGVLVSLDREILTPSHNEIFVKEKLLKIPSEFIEAYVYNGEVHKLLELPKQTFTWLNDKDFGPIRQRFLEIQGELYGSSSHKLVLEKYTSALSGDFIMNRKIRINTTLKDLSDTYRLKGGSSDLNEKIAHFIRSIPLKKLDKLPAEFIPHIPGHLTRYLAKQTSIQKLSAIQQKAITVAQKALISTDLEALDD